MRGVKCWTDHRLVRSFLSLHIAPVHCRVPKLTEATLHTTKLEHLDGREKFHSLLDNTLNAHEPLTEDLNEK